MGLMRGAVRHYCLGGCSALVVCARRWRPVRGAGAGAGCRVFPVSPFSPRVSRAVCAGPSRPGVPYPRSLVHHSMRSVGSAGLVRLPLGYCPRVLCVCVRARALAASTPAPLPWVVWRAHLSRSRCWALVGPFHASRAPQCVLPRSRAPFGLLVGGAARSRFPPTWLGAVRSPGVGLRVWGVPAPGGGVGGGGGGLRAVPPDGAAGGASETGGRLASVRPSTFPGQATKWVSLASLWPWRAWPPYRSCSCSLAVPGRGPLASLCAGAGLLVHCGSCGSRRLGAWRQALLRPPSRTPRSCGGGARPSSLPWGGWGAGVPMARGSVGGRWWGRPGGVAPWFPTSPLRGGRPVALRPVPPPSLAHPPQVYAFGRGRGAAPGAGCGLPPAGQPGRGGGRSASVRPSAFPGRATKRASLAAPRSLGVWPPILLRFVVACRPRAYSVCRPCALARARPPVAAPAGAGGRGRGGARRAGQAASPSGRRGPFGRRGGVPSASGGWRDGAPVACRPEGGVGGRGEGGPRRGSPTPCPGGPRPWPPAQSPIFSGAPPLGIYVQPGLPGSPGRRARPGRPSVGQPGGGGGALPVRRTPGGSPGELRGVGGGEVSLPRSVPPPTPGRHQGESLRPRPCCIPGCRRCAPAHGVPSSAGAELPVVSGHCGSEWAADWGCGVPPPGCPGPFGGAAGLPPP